MTNFPGYTYPVLVISVPCEAELVARMYTGKADGENGFKVLKEDVSLRTFCLQTFDTTDASFCMGGVLYNLLGEFRQTGVAALAVCKDG